MCYRASMKKQYVGMGVLVLVVIAAGWYFVGSQEPAVVPVVTPAPATTTPTTTPATTTDVATTTEIATSTNTTPTTLNEIELDLSKLQGKDRLYTEEEGKYENLSEEERRLVRKIVCTNNQFTWLCNTQSYVRDIRLVSLLDRQAVIYTTSGSTYNGWLLIYDISSAEITEKYQDWWDITFEPEYIFREEGIHDSADNQFKSSKLSFYKPGMTDFAVIPDSELEDGLTYLKWTGIVKREFSINYNGDLITTNVYSYDCTGSDQDVFTGLPKKCSSLLINTKTFDLSNLP
jgi:hypothetical protein